MKYRYRALIGLGNPGEAYAETRHNLGFRVVDRVARSLGATLERTGRVALAEVEKGDEKGDIVLVLIKPMTYVNLSGEAIEEVRERYGIGPEDMLVVVDDMSLPVGGIRVRGKGSDGGHNGLKSIIAALGTEAFPRLRVGIGPPGSDSDGDREDDADGDAGARDHVLSRFRAEELEAVNESLQRAADAASCWLQGNDLQQIMNKFNRRQADSSDAEIQPEPGSDGES